MNNFIDYLFKDFDIYDFYEFIKKEGKIFMFWLGLACGILIYVIVGVVAYIYQTLKLKKSKKEDK